MLETTGTGARGRGAAGTRQRRTFDARWLAAAAGLALALAAGVLAHMRINEPGGADPAGLAIVAAVLGAAVATTMAMVLRDAAVLWDVRREAAVAAADAAAAERHADLCSAAEARSRQLLEQLRSATQDALHDPFLADRLTRGPQRERSLLALLDEIDEHLGHRPAAD